MKEFTFLRMTDKLMNNEKTWMDFVKFTQQMHYNCSQEDEKDYDDDEESFSDIEKESYEYYDLKCNYNLL
ncbi:hypothetical protein M9Y10_003537 [Tritrichomonas musculus]|uniref:Uncharacterized protein n=1 Tax=Tritrichomonas musculus TaxID=1915356 RepID=A0ABR2JQF8_9EUKA